MLKFRKEGGIYIIISGFLIFLFILLGLKYELLFFFIFAGVMLIPGFFIAYFFRDPKRFPEVEKPGTYICPADGEIIVIDELEEAEHLKGPVIKVSIFMNVLSVHVNRSPIKGTIKKMIYIPGSFVPAFKDLASVENERIDILIEGENKIETRVVLIAGIVARRVIPFIHINQAVDKGEKIGMIKFGSRVDCFLPKDLFELKIKKGDKVFAGRTILAEKKVIQADSSIRM